jgi:hypothetical protein
MAPRSAFTARRAGYMLLGAAVLSASLLAHSLVAPATHAAIGGCNSDPIVTLSNGDVLDLHATVTDTYDDVEQVSYTLYVPNGVWVTSEVDTSLLGGKDAFRYYGTKYQAPNTYSVSVQVNTGASQIPVVAATDLVGVNGTLLSTARVFGLSQQKLWMNVSG